MTSAMNALCLLALWAFLHTVLAQTSSSTQTYASIAPPPKYAVRLLFPALAVPNAPPCNVTASGTACLPQVNAGVGQTVVINYSVLPAYSISNSTSTITLKACFSPVSTANRAWRKPNAVIAKDSSCSLQIASGLPPQGTDTWVVGPNVAPAVYSVMALEICAGGLYCSLGKSVGYFQVNAIDSRPPWLLALAGSFAAIGPLTLISFFLWEWKLKGKKTT